jgi:hypothetical protein
MEKSIKGTRTEQNLLKSFMLKNTITPIIV